MFLQLGIFQWAFAASGEYLDTKKGTRLNTVTDCTCSLVRAVLNHAFSVFCSLLLVSEFSISAFHMNRTHDGEKILQAVPELPAITPGSTQEILTGANGLVPQLWELGPLAGNTQQPSQHRGCRRQLINADVCGCKKWGPDPSAGLLVLRRGFDFASP